MWKNIQKRFGSSESYISLALGLAVVLMLGSLIYNYVTNKSGTDSKNQKTQEMKNETSTALPTKHTVAKNETLWMISEKYYKSGFNWIDIKKANNLVNEDGIEVGQVLDIPVVTPIVPSRGAQITGATGAVSGTSTESSVTKKTYKVVKDDSLWKISLREYNNGYKWVDIARVNNITNPDLIFPDTVLVLP